MIFERLYNIIGLFESDLLNNSTEQSRPCEADSSSASQEIPRILRNPKVH